MVSCFALYSLFSSNLFGFSCWLFFNWWSYFAFCPWYNRFCFFSNLEGVYCLKNRLPWNYSSVFRRNVWINQVKAQKTNQIPLFVIRTSTNCVGKGKCLLEQDFVAFVSGCPMCFTMHSRICCFERNDEISTAYKTACDI